MPTRTEWLERGRDLVSEEGVFVRHAAVRNARHEY